MKVNQLEGAALDWAVSKCEGREPSYYKGRMRATAHPDFPDSPPMFGPELNYSTDWAQGGPIIEREKIEIFIRDEVWFAYSSFSKPEDFNGDTPLIAAMRCYVAGILGDEIELPDGLLQGEKA